VKSEKRATKRLTEGLELRGESEAVHGEDEPLGRVVLVPLDGVTEVLREFVVLLREIGVSEDCWRPRLKALDSRSCGSPLR
jgi:hypothetical protein